MESAAHEGSGHRARAVGLLVPFLGVGLVVACLLASA
jgi:hypothetical protein